MRCSILCALLCALTAAFLSGPALATAPHSRVMLTDLKVETSKSALQAQISRSRDVIEFFTKKHAKGRWMIHRRHYRCSSVVGKPQALCFRSRKILRAHRWLFGVATQRLEALSPCYRATGVGEGNPNVDLGCEMAAKRGWTGQQWEDLYDLWDDESGWSNYADNPGSDACGIPQAMNNCSFGYEPEVQIEWGLNYIAGRYSTPSGARSAFNSRSPSWY